MDVTHPAFDVIAKDVVSEYGAYTTLYKHKKSGAELLSVANDDDNKVCWLYHFIHVEGKCIQCCDIFVLHVCGIVSLTDTAYSTSLLRCLSGLWHYVQDSSF